MNRKIRTLSVVGAAVIGATVAGSVAVAASPPPPMPPWVNSDGRVDMDKMPDEMLMLDSQGNTIVDAEGKPIMHKVDKGPPPDGPGPH